MTAGRKSGDTAADDASQRLRLDKYLWFARVVKTRTLAAKLVASGQVRVNSARCVNPAKQVGQGDVLTIALDRTVRVLRIVAKGERRGPFEEARVLYEELTEAGLASSATERSGDSGAGRAKPDKRERRLAAALKRGD